MAPPVPGDELAGRYRLERLLADDGVIQRWAAVDHVLARPVEIEVLSPGAGGPEREAFVAASAAAARLSHPSIINAYDRGSTADGLPFLVTERAVGPTLAELEARQGAVPPGRVTTIGQQVAQALDAVHRAGGVHGGVGPGTVQVREDDHAKLTGFTAAGTHARLAGASPTPRDDVDACARTLAGALIGGASAAPAGPVSPRAEAPGVPPSLDRLLVAAQGSGPIATAAELAARLASLSLDDDARPLVDPRPTPPVATPPVSATRPGGTGRSGAVAGIIVGLLLAIGVGVAAFALFNRGGSGNNTPPGPGTPTTAGTLAPKGAQYAIVSAQSYDPFGDHTEQQQLAANVFDGNAATLWSTEEYATARFGGLKPGVGIYVQLDATHQLHQLVVNSPSRGWVFSVYVAAHPSDALAGWGQPVASGVTVSKDLTPVDLRNTSGAAVLVWITDLGPPLRQPPQAATPYRVDIADVQLS